MESLRNQECVRTCLMVHFLFVLKSFSVGLIIHTSDLKISNALIVKLLKNLK